MLSTVIHTSTAGPDQLRASHSELLHLVVKDDKGNLHQLMLENAPVVPNLSQNLTSQMQFVESGHMVFFHETQAGLVLNKKPKLSPIDIVIPFTTGENGYTIFRNTYLKTRQWQWLCKNSEVNKRRTCTHIIMLCLPVADETSIQSNTSS